MLDIIDTKVDKAQVHMDNVNIKMKQALDGVRRPRGWPDLSLFSVGHEGRQVHRELRLDMCTTGTRVLHCQLLCAINLISKLSCRTKLDCHHRHRGLASFFVVEDGQKAED